MNEDYKKARLFVDNIGRSKSKSIKNLLLIIIMLVSLTTLAFATSLSLIPKIESNLLLSRDSFEPPGTNTLDNPTIIENNESSIENTSIKPEINETEEQEEFEEHETPPEPEIPNMPPEQPPDEPPQHVLEITGPVDAFEGEDVEFTITLNGEPVQARVIFGDALFVNWSNSSTGKVTFMMPTEGEYVVTAEVLGGLNATTTILVKNRTGGI